ECAASTCAVALLGTGADGALNVTADTVINNVRSGSLTAAAGQAVLGVFSLDAGFAVNDVVMLHQTRGTGAGSFEIGTISSVNAGANQLTLVRNIKNTYSSTGDNRAQIVKIPLYTTVNIASGVTLTAPAWDGTTGGILAFKATGVVTVDGK